MTQLHPSISKKITRLYKDEFNYIDHDSLFFEGPVATLSGKLFFKGSSYLKNGNKCKIFNNVDFYIASNQITFLTAACLLAHKEQRDMSDEAEIDIFYKLINHFVVKENTIFFQEPVYANDTVPFVCQVMAHKKMNQSIYGHLNIIIGGKQNFNCSIKGFILPNDAHVF